MNRFVIAVAAGVIALASQAGIAFAKDEDVKTKTVTLETFFRKPGYPIPEKSLPASLKNGYSDLIVKYAKRYGVPTNLAHAVVSVESKFNPKARGSAGEVGLMQIKPATARMMGFRGTTKALYDPETNIRWGMQYLATAHQLGGGEVCSTILRYNAGHGATRMNPVSKRYCGKVQALLAS
ncbi:lytic transglycosylase domain-containing protein [Agrobacterium fabrum]|jgi:soluble lytic murein transglycosylase-like protein|uniref:Transglycosylase SLT domain-containing protein n=1 Tax=Agrobacterium fabrum TaxID=1176649 RepID=A0A7Z7BG68_9HYPH|nr:lytic transglycosylase domain-containing protein [Agrobacterium fabrum]MCR6724451.1 lytic transglycosylase domain-containing protein [Agrobacterium fabrum]WCK75436.1 lytic transglycosylase domain-containing protein [Agrobacterium fabrum]WIE26531.1 lytic transglycosylase domain-containing protein [Agrobacterium fabrum]WIE42487.1 lytic transglycosylase domain-containing protein [Agrobacterium fabrum]CUX10879.1 Soluble lytic transglycosylase [Agrobacterium fabrum str. J-07]